MSDEQRIAYLERQSAGRLRLLEDLDATKKHLEHECDRLHAALAASEAARAALAAACIGEDTYGPCCNLCLAGGLERDAVDHDADCILAAQPAAAAPAPKEAIGSDEIEQARQEYLKRPLALRLVGRHEDDIHRYGFREGYKAARADRLAARVAELEAALGQACEAVSWLLECDWPEDSDPGPNIRTGLGAWRTLVAPLGHQTDRAGRPAPGVEG